MKLTTNVLRGLILEVLNEERKIKDLEEAKMEDLTDVCFIVGSTHSIATCKIGEDNYYVKFSDSNQFSTASDKSMQIGVEYLAYKIYELYPSNIPEGIHVVSDPSNKRIGLATAEVKGVSGRQVDYRTWVKSISGGAMVDIFLANWDVANTNNFIVDQETGLATRVDPGGSLTFRAQGGRKGDSFSRQAGELKTMLDPNKRGAGFLLSAVDMKKACEDFLSVSWEQIAGAIEQARQDVSQELQAAGLSQEVSAWDQECDHIASILESRHSEIVQHCEYALGEM